MLIILEVMVNFLVIIGRDGNCYFGGNNLGIFFVILYLYFMDIFVWIILVGYLISFIVFYCVLYVCDSVFFFIFYLSKFFCWKNDKLMR